LLTVNWKIAFIFAGGHNSGVATKENKPTRRPLPAREREICLRLRQVREFLRLSQQEFSDQIGISRPRLASYEELRAPLRYEIAVRMCRQFMVSEEWLATGKRYLFEVANGRDMGKLDFGPLGTRACMCLAFEPVYNQVKPGTLFSKAFDSHFSNICRSLAMTYMFRPRIEFHPGDNIQMVKNYVLFMLDRWSSLMDEKEIIEFYWRLMTLGEELYACISETSDRPKEQQAALMEMSGLHVVKKPDAAEKSE
jgi:DNA-binding XRE family transcriptional regulator